jgi:hypothetical protein
MIRPYKKTKTVKGINLLYGSRRGKAKLMEEILNLNRGEEWTFTSLTDSWLGLITQGNVSGSGGYQEIIWTIDNDQLKVVIINSPARIKCHTQSARIVWFKDYDLSANFGKVELTVGQSISIGLSEVLLLPLVVGEPAKEFEFPLGMEGFVLKGEIHVEAQIYESMIGGRVEREIYYEGDGFKINAQIGQLKLRCQGKEDALVFLIWGTEAPLADIHRYS